MVLPSASRSRANAGGVAPWSGTRFNAPASSSTVAPATGAAATSVRNTAAASVRSISAEDRLGQQRRHRHVRQIDDVADPKVDRHAADDVRLLAREPSIGKQAHHIKDRVAAREVEVLTLIGSF